MCECIRCGGEFPVARQTLGYDLCLKCGETDAQIKRRSWTVAPMNKSNYILVTDPSILSQLNPKRTTA